MAEQKELLRGIVDRFRSAGYQIWMDDFGSAYSSLNILKEMYFDEIKLDMSFLRPFNLRSKRIATAVVEMAKNIDIHTLVEGVETEEQFAYLRNIGCEKVQGYYFGRPMPYEDALAHLRKQDIRIEVPEDRQYYEEIGRTDVLSAVPFMTRAERDAIVTARQLNSIPLAMAEFDTEAFRILFYNSAFEEMVEGKEIFSAVLSQETLTHEQPYYRISEKIINLMDSVKTAGEGKMLFTSNDEYFDVTARCIARTRDRYTVLMRILNLSGKDAQTENFVFWMSSCEGSTICLSGSHCSISGTTRSVPFTHLRRKTCFPAGRESANLRKSTPKNIFILMTGNGSGLCLNMRMPFRV